MHKQFINTPENSFLCMFKLKADHNIGTDLFMYITLTAYIAICMITAAYPSIVFLFCFYDHRIRHNLLLSI